MSDPTTGAPSVTEGTPTTDAPAATDGPDATSAPLAPDPITDAPPNVFGQATSSSSSSNPEYTGVVYRLALKKSTKEGWRLEDVKW